MILRKNGMTYTRGIERAVLAVLALLWLAPPSQAGFFPTAAPTPWTSCG